jgi:hypothetical protein
LSWKDQFCGSRGCGGAAEAEVATPKATVTAQAVANTARALIFTLFCGHAAAAYRNPHPSRDRARRSSHLITTS